MSNILENALNVKLINLLCSGVGVSVNISVLSEMLKKHRNTIKNKVTNLFEHGVVVKPSYHFTWLLQEYSLFVIEKSNFPRDTKTNTWIEKDPYIWAAFFIKEEEYNTLMIEVHKDLYAYQNWKENIFDEGYITIDYSQSYPSEATFLSAKSIIKHKPSASIPVIRDNLKNKTHTQINGLVIDELSFNILTSLMTGKVIRTNENLLAKELNVHRKTVQRRIELFLQEKILDPPSCLFPRIWTPPEYFLVISLVQIKKRSHKKQILKTLANDPHVAFMANANTGKYDLVLFSNFYRMEDHLAWQEEYDQQFRNCLGAIRNTYLSPAMTFSIDHHYISLLFLENKLKRLKAKNL